MEMKTLKEELHAMRNQIHELDRKMLNLEAKKETLMKTNVEMKSTLDEKEDAIMTKWKDVVLREAPKTLVHKNLAMNSSTTNALQIQQ